MSITLNILEEVQEDGGTTLRTQTNLSVEALDKYNVDIVDGTDVQVDLHFGVATVSLFYLKVTGLAALETVDVKFGSAANPAFTLGETLLLRGTSILAVLGADLDSLYVTHALGKTLTFEIYVGRDSTP